MELRCILVHQGHRALSEDIFGPSTCGSTNGIWWVEPRDATRRDGLAPDVYSAKAEKLWSLE